MKLKFRKINFLWALIFFMGVAACSKEDSEGLNDGGDPIIGNWKLKVIIIDGNINDVSAMTCYKDSYCKVTSNEITMHLSFPDGNSCREDTSSSKWEKRNGTYYEFDANGNSYPLPVSLENGNFELTYSSNGQTTRLIFTK